MTKSLFSYAKCLALRLNGSLAVVRDAAPAWLAGQVARYRQGAVQTQPCGPGLFAHRTASSLSHVPTYALSFFLVLRANRSRREAPGI